MENWKNTPHEGTLHSSNSHPCIPRSSPPSVHSKFSTHLGVSSIDVRFDGKKKFGVDRNLSHYPVLDRIGVRVVGQDDQGIFDKKPLTLAGYRDTFLYQIELMKRGAGRRPEFSPDEAIRFLNDQSKAPANVEEFRKLCQSHLTTLLERLHTSDDDESAFFRRGEAKEGDLRNWLAARLRDVGERYYTVIREQEVAGEKRPDLRLHSRVDALGKVSVEIKLADMAHWKGDQLVNTPGDQLSKQYLLEPSSHTGIYVLVNAARPRKVEKDKKTKKVKRSAFRKSVDGNAVNFQELIALVEEKCAEVNDGLVDGKMVVAVTRDISEKPSDTP